jgi:hypothetical protein
VRRQVCLDVEMFRVVGRGPVKRSLLNEDMSLHAWDDVMIIVGMYCIRSGR